MLTNAITSAPIANEPVTLKLNGAETCTGTTDTTGTASCFVTPGEASGTYPLTGTFGGDATASPHLLGSTGSNTFVVTPDPTVTLYTGATTATNGSAATLSGVLTAFGNALPNKTVTLTLGTGGTAQSCTGTTNAAGSASCVIGSVNQTVGSVPVTASFAGDSYYLASTVSASVGVSGAPIPTTLKVNSATGQYNVATAVSGVLTNSATSAAIASEPVTFKLNGSETCTGITNSTGTASCSVTPAEGQGTYPLTGTFAGDTTVSPTLLASNGSNTFVVTPDPTVLTYTGATTANNGSPITVSGVLTAFGNALPNKTVTLTLGTGGTAQSCAGTTNAAGSASCVIGSVNQTVGSVPVTDTFAGDNFYLPSNGASSVTVSPPPPIPTTLKVNPATGQYNVATAGVGRADQLDHDGTHRQRAGDLQAQWGRDLHRDHQHERGGIVLRHAGRNPGVLPVDRHLRRRHHGVPAPVWAAPGPTPSWSPPTRPSRSTPGPRRRPMVRPPPCPVSSPPSATPCRTRPSP